MGGKGGKGGWVGRWRRQRTIEGEIFTTCHLKKSIFIISLVVIVRTCRLYYRVTSSPVMICDCS